ncbi:MAG: hypothetical protein AAF456_08890 [Planctomycetota bacterium]
MENPDSENSSLRELLSEAAFQRLCRFARNRARLEEIGQQAEMDMSNHPQTPINNIQLRHEGHQPLKTNKLRPSGDPTESGISNDEAE